MTASAPARKPHQYEKHTHQFSVRLNSRLERELSEFAERRGYSSRVEALRDLVRRGLEAQS